MIQSASNPSSSIRSHLMSPWSPPEDPISKVESKRAKHKKKRKHRSKSRDCCRRSRSRSNTRARNRSRSAERLRKPSDRKRAQSRSGSRTRFDDSRDNLAYKTRLCRNWEKFGHCPYGYRCQFRHENEDGPRSWSTTPEDRRWVIPHSWHRYIRDVLYSSRGVSSKRCEDVSKGLKSKLWSPTNPI